MTIPQTPHEWLLEIERAAKDAAKTKPFALLTGTVLTDSKLFHLAPLVALKFRGIRLASEKRDELIETVLASYVVNADGGASSGLPDLKANPMIAFSLCYVATHLVLELVSDEQAQAILSACEKRWTVA